MTASDEDEIVAHLAAMVSMPTAYPPGDTEMAAAYVLQQLTTMGYATATHTFRPKLDNVVARMGSGKPSLVFNAHLDTVGAGDLTLWSRPPLQASVENGFVFGLGAANCKGSAAVQLWLAGEIARRGGPAKGEVVFTFVADEESLDGNGMRALRERGIVQPDYLLLGAPTDNAIVHTERGVLWIEITALGTQAHAGQPEDGDNAILRMMRVLGHVDREMKLRLSGRADSQLRSTINIGLIRGGENTNVVPGRCTVQIDRRLLPSETVEEAWGELLAVISSAGEPSDRILIERLRGTNGFRGSDSASFVVALRSAIESVTLSPARYSTAIGVSDGRYFAGDPVEIVNFGPGIGSEGHASNESVSIASIHQSALILDRLFDDLLGYVS
jgi:acetylornithine deacetylase/succinyl-diaminopimelate desuccinylase family protein